jgi:hypothetical protein
MLSYRYLSPHHRIYMLSQPDRKHPLSTGRRRFLSVPHTSHPYNVLIGFIDDKLCDEAMEKLRFQRLERHHVNVQFLMHLSDSMNMQSIVLMSSPEAEFVEMFFYHPNRR